MLLLIVNDEKRILLFLDRKFYEKLFFEPFINAFDYFIF